MNICEAAKLAMKAGKRMFRRSEPDIRIDPDGGKYPGVYTCAKINIKSAEKPCTWAPRRSDLLAEDWEIDW